MSEFSELSFEDNDDNYSDEERLKNKQRIEDLCNELMEKRELYQKADLISLSRHISNTILAVAIAVIPLIVGKLIFSEPIDSSIDDFATISNTIITFSKGMMSVGWIIFAYGNYLYFKLQPTDSFEKISRYFTCYVGGISLSIISYGLSKIFIGS